MSPDIAIRVTDLGKRYEIYDSPSDRLKQFLMPPVQRRLGKFESQYFTEFWALKEVSFQVGRGETIGVIGRNGSGKSTLLQMICGTVSPTTGNISTRGRVAALLELGAGFNIEFTGRENVLHNAAILGVSTDEMEERMREVHEFSELGSFLDQPVKTYSSGMYARLAFSIAINVNPDILIVDEALAVGDARFVAKCMRRIKDIQSLGATILFVSHDVSSVRTLCGRAIWLDGGKLLEDGAVFPVTGRYMAFMYRDGDASDFKVENISSENLATSGSELSHAVAVKSELAAANLSKDEINTLTVNALNLRPVTHWGSCKGIILSAAVFDVQNNRSDVHAWGAIIQIVVKVNIPSEIKRKGLNVAFSIKDLKGTDLIVSTVQDFPNGQLPPKACFSVSFTLKNWLVSGSYLLVAAVENRQHRDIHYYEYIEGAHYFSSVADDQFFGIFQPAVELTIE